MWKLTQGIPRMKAKKFFFRSQRYLTKNRYFDSPLFDTFTSSYYKHKKMTKHYTSKIGTQAQKDDQVLDWWSYNFMMAQTGIHCTYAEGKNSLKHWTQMVVRDWQNNIKNSCSYTMRCARKKEKGIVNFVIQSVSQVQYTWYNMLKLR